MLLALVIAAGVLNYLDRQAIAVLKPLISRDLHWSDSDYGGFAALFQIGAVVGYLGAGRAVDRLGVRWATPAGLVAWSVAAISHAFARGSLAFSAVRFSLGLTESMGTPAGIKTISALFSAGRRAAAIGLGNAAGNVGAILTPLIVPALALASGWRASFVVIGAAGLVLAAVWVPIVLRLQAPRDAAPPAQPPAPILRDRRVWALAGAKALADQVWWLLLFWAPDFLNRVFHLQLGQIAGPLAVIYGMAALGSLLGGVASTALVRRGVEVVRARRIVLGVCAMLVLPAPLALATPNAWIAVALIGLLLGAHQGFSVNMFALFGDVIEPSRVGRATAFGSLLGNLAGMALVYGAGLILQAGWGYEPLLFIAAGSYVAAFFWQQLLLPRRDTASRPS